jgi:hypothetical protein
MLIANAGFPHCENGLPKADKTKPHTTNTANKNNALHKQKTNAFLLMVKLRFGLKSLTLRPLTRKQNY